MDSHNLAQPAGEHEADLPTTAQHTTASIIPAPSVAAVQTAGTPTTISTSSPPTTPIAIMSDAGGSPWPHPPTPGPGPTLPDRIFHFDSVDTPPHTPIPGPIFSQHPVSLDTLSNDHPNSLASNRVDDSTPLPPTPLLGIFVLSEETARTSSPVLCLRPDAGAREQYGAIKPLDDKMARTGGFEVGDPADEDFYGVTDTDLGSDASSLSCFWASRFNYKHSFFNRGSRDVGESVRAREHEHKPHADNHDGASQTNAKGKHKAKNCAYCDLVTDPHHDSYFSDSGTATGDDAPRQLGPFVPSFHDSQATPVKRGSFVFHGRYEADVGNVHERGGDGKDEAILPAGCELEFPLAPGGSENRQSHSEDAMFAPSGSRREVSRLPASMPVNNSRPPAAASFYRVYRSHRSPIPATPEPSVIQLLTPQGTIGVQFNDVVDVQVTAKIELLGEGYRAREIRSTGEYYEVGRRWGGVKGCVVELKGGNKWELKSIESESEASREDKKRRGSSSGFYDGDDEGTIGVASDDENEVALLNAQPTNPDIFLGPGEKRPYILDMIYDDPDKAVTRYTDVSDYSVSILRAEKGNSCTVRVRDMTGALVLTWKRVARMEIVLVGGVMIEVNLDNEEEGENTGAEVAAADVGLRGGGDKDKLGESDQEGKVPEKTEGYKERGQAIASSSTVETPRSTLCSDYPGEFRFQVEDSTHSAGNENGAETPKNPGKDKGKGKAVGDGNASPWNHCDSSDSEDHGSIPLYYEAPADDVQMLGPPRRLDNPEPDYVLGSCPCLDRPIADAGTDADPPKCTCIRPASPESPAPGPWTRGYFSRRYQEFLRDGPPSAPYSHSCTAHSESHGEWVGEVRETLGEGLASYAPGSEVPGHAAPKGGSSIPKPLDIKQTSGVSPEEDAPKAPSGDAEGERMKDRDSQITASSLDGPSKEAGTEAKAAGPESSQSDSHTDQYHNADDGGNSSAHVNGDTARRNGQTPSSPESPYPDARPARLRFSAPPSREAGQQQSVDNYEPAPPIPTRNPERSTQPLPTQPAHPYSSSRGDYAHPVEDEVLRLREAIDLLRDLLAKLGQ